MKGKKIQNFLYTCTVAASLLSLSIYTLTREPTESSLSENRMLASVKNLGDTSYADGTFQAGVENALSDQFPYREEIVRLKKKEERKFTVVQAPPEPITVLHKMPDINVYELGTSDRMINGVGEYSQEKADRYAARADQINKLSIRHPQAAIYVYYPTQVNETSLFDKDNNITAAGPQMIQLLQNTLTVPFKTLDIPDIETYERLFFMSDHHPNYQGSRQIYEDIMTMIGKTDQILAPSATVCAGDFYGTFASRTGYTTKPDQFCMYDYDLPDYDIYDENNQLQNDAYQSRHDFAVNHASIQGEYPYYYALCYTAFQPIMRFDTKQEDLGNCLIVGDSYSTSVADLLAANFHETWLLYPYLYTQKYQKLFDYDHFIEDNKITTVIYMLTGENYYYVDQYEDRYTETVILPNGGNY